MKPSGILKGEGIRWIEYDPAVSNALGQRAERHGKSTGAVGFANSSRQPCFLRHQRSTASTWPEVRPLEAVFGVETH